MKSVLVQQVWLAASILLLGLVLWAPVLHRFGANGAGGLVLAAALCLIPGLMVLVFQSLWGAVGFAGFGALAGGVFRALFAVAGFLAVRRYCPEMPPVLFGSLLAVFYLLSAAVETWLVVRSLGRE